jgi:hypothetical protein
MSYSLAAGLFAALALMQKRPPVSPIPDRERREEHRNGH